MPGAETNLGSKGFNFLKEFLFFKNISVEDLYFWSLSAFFYCPLELM